MLTSLLAHLAWADDAARAGVAQMPVTAPEYGRALDIYAHIAAAEHIWLSRLEGRAPAHAVWPQMSLVDAAALASASAAGLAAYAEHGSPDDLGREIVYRTSAGQEMRNSVEEILAHVALHGSYHRGQLALLARAAGTAPIATDYIVFTRTQRG